MNRLRPARCLALQCESLPTRLERPIPRIATRRALHISSSRHQQQQQQQQQHDQRQTPSLQSFLPPLNISKWASENAHRLQPPINNYCVHSSPLTVMIVGGPNARTEFHINSTPEFFYQHKGRMLLRLMTKSAAGEGQGEAAESGGLVQKDVYIDQGEMFLLPANVPHCPIRFADTVGVVVEQPRPEGEVDRLRWYCAGCGDVVNEEGFVATDLGSQIKQAVQGFERDQEKRVCKKCGTRCEVRPSEEEMERMRTGPHGA